MTSFVSFLVARPPKVLVVNGRAAEPFGPLTAAATTPCPKPRSMSSRLLRGVLDSFWLGLLSLPDVLLARFSGNFPACFSGFFIAALTATSAAILAFSAALRLFTASTSSFEGPLGDRFRVVLSTFLLTLELAGRLAAADFLGGGGGFCAATGADDDESDNSVSQPGEEEGEATFLLGGGFGGCGTGDFALVRNLDRERDLRGTRAAGLDLDRRGVLERPLCTTFAGRRLLERRRDFDFERRRGCFTGRDLERRQRDLERRRDLERDFDCRRRR